MELSFYKSYTSLPTCGGAVEPTFLLGETEGGILHSKSNKKTPPPTPSRKGRGALYFLSQILLSIVMYDTVLAGDFAALRGDVNVDAEIVTLGDLVENAGVAGKTPMFRAPDLGTKGAISAERVADAARAAGLQNIDTRGMASVYVTRAARAMRSDHVHDVVQQALAEKMKANNANDVAISFDVGTPNYMIENGARAEPTLVRMDWNPNTNRFEALVVVADSRLSNQNPMVFRGQAEEMIQVARLVKPINKGASVTTDDFVIEPFARTKLPQDAVADMKTLNGMSAKRAIPAGLPLRMSDLERSKKVLKQDLVTVIFENGGITISTRGKSLADGAVGDMVSVQNMHTKKIMEGKVVGAGLVSVEPSYVNFRNKTALNAR